jgi:hypothetical protein
MIHKICFGLLELTYDMRLIWEKVSYSKEFLSTPVDEDYKMNNSIMFYYKVEILSGHVY